MWSRAVASETGRQSVPERGQMQKTGCFRECARPVTRSHKQLGRGKGDDMNNSTRRTLLLPLVLTQRAMTARFPSSQREND